MSFRQFPATAADGERHVIIEFRDEARNNDADARRTRYELDDGRPLRRYGRQYTTRDGELRLLAE